MPEVLVALAILAVTVTALVQVHTGVLRAGGQARGMEAAVTQLGNIAALAFLGTDDGAIVETVAAGGWTATVEGRAGGGDGALWKVWTVTTSNQPAPAMSLMLMDAATTAGKATGQGARGN